MTANIQIEVNPININYAPPPPKNVTTFHNPLVNNKDSYVR